MVVCDFLKTFADGQKIVCTLTLDGDKVTGVAEPGYEVLLENILEESVCGAGGKKFWRADDPVGWFNALPIQYDGFYLRAWIHADKRRDRRRKKSGEPGASS